MPSFEIGVRHGGGDAETGFGADIGAGLAWSDPARGVSAELRARGLLTHEDGTFSERGFSGAFAWDPAPDSDRGVSLTIRQTVGANAAGGMEALLRPETARVFGAADDDAGALGRRRLEAKLGYGLAHFGGRYTGTAVGGLAAPRRRSARSLSAGAWPRRGARGWYSASMWRRRGTSAWSSIPGRSTGSGSGSGGVSKAGRRETPPSSSGSRARASRTAADDPEHRFGLEVTARW